MLEEELGKREYVASDQYSLADINIFNSTYTLAGRQARPVRPEADAEHLALAQDGLRAPRRAADLGDGQGRFTDRFTR